MEAAAVWDDIALNLTAGIKNGLPWTAFMANATASSLEMVLFPTPPLGLYTLIIRRAIFCMGSGWASLGYRYEIPGFWAAGVL